MPAEPLPEETLPDGSLPDESLPDEPDGGDPVCWLDRLCPHCGAMPTEGEQATCWRCGALLPRDGTT